MIEELKKLPQFKEVNQNILEDLVLNNEIIKYSYNKGATVHEQHSLCNGMDIVISGKLIAYSLSPNGSENIVFEFSKGNVIGGNLLFGEQNNYPMNIYCTVNSSIFHLSKKAVEILLKEYHFVVIFVKLLSLSSQGMNEKIAMYTQKTLRENIIDYLTDLSNQQESKYIILPISKKQLADYLGVQRPSLFRELKKMKEENLIRIDNRMIQLL